MKPRTLFVAAAKKRGTLLSRESEAFLALRSYQILAVDSITLINRLARIARLRGWLTVSWKDPDNWKIMKIRANKMCPHCKKPL